MNPLRLERTIHDRLVAAGWAEDLTQPALNVLAYMAAHVVEFQMPPTYADMARRFGYSNRSAGSQMCHRLFQRGLLEESGDHFRPWRVVPLVLSATIPPPAGKVTNLRPRPRVLTEAAEPPTPEPEQTHASHP